MWGLVSVAHYYGNDLEISANRFSVYRGNAGPQLPFPFHLRNTD